jgi:hypothetical protein
VPIFESVIQAVWRRGSKTGILLVQRKWWTRGKTRNAIGAPTVRAY